MVSECTHFISVGTRIRILQTSSCLCLYLFILWKVWRYTLYALCTIKLPIQFVSSRLCLRKVYAWEGIFFLLLLFVRRKALLWIMVNNAKSNIGTCCILVLILCSQMNGSDIILLYVCMMKNSMHALVPCPNVDCKGTKWPMIWYFIYANDTNKYVIQSGSNVFDDTSTVQLQHSQSPIFLVVVCIYPPIFFALSIFRCVSYMNIIYCNFVIVHFQFFV